MIIIDEERLHSFLQERKTKICQDRFPLDGIFTAITFLFSLITLEYSKIALFSNIIVVALFWGVFFVYLVFQIVKIIQFFKNKYSVEDLFYDLKQLQNTVSQYSLHIIKSDIGIYKNCFLLKYDKRWKCYLLPYTKSAEDEKNDHERVESCVSKNLSIDKNFIDVNLIKTEKYTKYSYSNERTKNYQHRFYEITILSIINKSNKKSFKINNAKYKWFSIEDMKNNKKIMERNKDVILIMSDIYG